MTTRKEFEEDIRKHGFLAETMKADIADRRGMIGGWFKLAEATSDVLQGISHRGMVINYGPGTRKAHIGAQLIFIRGLSLMQGSIKLAELGMDIESRMLIRGQIECAICLAALMENPDSFEKEFDGDFSASRRKISALALKLMPPGPEDSQFAEYLANAEKNAVLFDIAKMAKAGGLTNIYFIYRVLSNDSAHLSADSLARNFDSGTKDRPTDYLIGPSDYPEIVRCLELSILTANILASKFLELTHDEEGLAAMVALNPHHDKLRAESPMVTVAAENCNFTAASPMLAPSAEDQAEKAFATRTAGLMAQTIVPKPSG